MGERSTDVTPILNGKTAVGHLYCEVMRARLSSLVCCLLLLGTLVSQRTSLAASARGAHQNSRAMVVVIDPGHGGDDPGAADNGLVEKVLTLRVAKVAQKDLQGMGFRVYLTRYHDEDVNVPPRDVNHDGHIDHVDELAIRNVIANRHHADAFVSIHFDAGGTLNHGTHGYWCPNRPFWQANKRLAGILSTSVTSSLQRAGVSSVNNGIGTDVADPIPQTRQDYPWFLVLGPSLKRYVIATAMPGALIETLYLTSAHDAAALHHVTTIAALGRGYALGILSYFHGQTRR